MTTKVRSSTTDYSNREVDLLLLQFAPSPEGEVEVFPDVSRSPRIVTGIEKLVQRYAHLFLTNVGSVKNRETEGTEFITSLERGRIYDINTLQTAASLANKVTQKQIRTADLNTDIARDEELASSEVVDCAIDRLTATVLVTIKITSAAGESFLYVTPLKTGV